MKRETEDALRIIGWILLFLLLVGVLGVISFPFLRLG